MDQTQAYIITMLAIIIIGIIVLIYSINANSKEKIVINDLSDIKRHSYLFSPAVLELASDILNHPERFEADKHVIYVAGRRYKGDIEWWIANSMESQCFYGGEKEKREEFNSKLTKYDLRLMWTIYNQIKD